MKRDIGFRYTLKRVLKMNAQYGYDVEKLFEINIMIILYL